MYRIAGAAVFAVIVGVAPAAQAQDVQVWAGGQPGPYEVHVFQHRGTSFDRQPYFATHPPVYYGPQRLVRSYGWTPYPYLGSQYDVGPTRKAEVADAKPAEKPQPTKQAKERKKARPDRS